MMQVVHNCWLVEYPNYTRIIYNFMILTLETQFSRVDGAFIYRSPQIIDQYYFQFSHKKS